MAHLTRFVIPGQPWSETYLNMFDQPSTYPWSSYACNAPGQANANLTPHRLYRHLGKTAEDRRKAYRALFHSRISEQNLDEIRETTNKAWGLGSNRFKQQIKNKLNRRAAPLARGGDRRSEKYRES